MTYDAFSYIIYTPKQGLAITVLLRTRSMAALEGALEEC